MLIVSLVSLVFLLLPSAMEVEFAFFHFLIDSFNFKWRFCDSRAASEIKHCRIQTEGRLYSIDNVMQFESLVELVNYYGQVPLYRKVQLLYPVTQEFVRRIGVVSHRNFCFISFSPQGLGSFCLGTVNF